MGQVVSNSSLLGVCQAEKLDGIGANVEQLLQSGVKGVVAGGVYSDARMTKTERLDVLKRICGAVNKRVPVMTLQSAQCEHQTNNPTDEDPVPKLNFKKTQQQQQQKPKPPPVQQSFVDVRALPRLFYVCNLCC